MNEKPQDALNVQKQETKVDKSNSTDENFVKRKHHNLSILVAVLALLVGYVLGLFFPITTEDIAVQSNTGNQNATSNYNNDEFVPICDRQGSGEGYNEEVLYHDLDKMEITFKSRSSYSSNYTKTYCDNIKVTDGNTGDAVDVSKIKNGAIINTKRNNFKILEIEVVDF